MSDHLTDTDMDFTKLKVAELKTELKKRGLSTEGKKTDLVERLQTSIGDSALLDDAHDDLLDDEDLSDEVLDDTAIENTLETSQDKTAIKRVGDKGEESPAPKKIVLNRKVVEAPDPPLQQEPVVEKVDSVANEPTGQKVVAKIGSLSMIERLAKRKARFSDSSATAPVVAVTAGSAVKTDAVVAPIVSSKTGIDVLKKRAERFGTVAPVLEKAQLEEKKILRMKRFGGDGKSETNGSVADKKAQRAARFQRTS